MIRRGKRHVSLLCILFITLMMFGCGDKKTGTEDSNISSADTSASTSSTDTSSSGWTKISLGAETTGINSLVTDKLFAYNYDSVFVSTDGLSFNKVLEREGSAFSRLYAAGSKYILTTGDSRWYLWMSDDGTDFTLHTDNMGYYNGMYGITFAEGKYIGTTSRGELSLSDDGLIWRSHKVNQLSFFLDDMLRELVYSDGTYYGLMGSALAIADNISEWKTIKPDLAYDCTMVSLAVNGSTVLVSTYNANSLYRLVNDSLVEIEDMKGKLYNKLVYSGGFYAMSSDGTVSYSQNGESWSELYTTPSSDNSIFNTMEIFGDSVYLFSNNGDVYYRSLSD